MTQPGVQILTAFLLIIPFQARFIELSCGQSILYLVLISCGFLTTALMIAPVSLDRFLFQHGQKIEVVRISTRITAVVLTSLGILITGTVALVFSVVLGGVASWIAAVTAATLLITIWLIMPWRARSASTSRG